ncbi:MAG: type II secretion system protein [Bacillota bacterium]
MLIKIGERMKRIREREQGFTLIELLVVIVILGVIAALVVPKVVGNVDDAKKKADELTAKQLTNAVNQYKAVTGDYPNALSELVPKYIDKVPKQQSNDKDFTYDKTNGVVTVTP